jgi:hypothetical protein
MSWACMFWRCVPTCPLYCIVGEFAASISSSVWRQMFKVHLSLIRCLKYVYCLNLVDSLGSAHVLLVWSRLENDQRICQNTILLQRRHGRCTYLRWVETLSSRPMQSWARSAIPIPINFRTTSLQANRDERSAPQTNEPNECPARSSKLYDWRSVSMSVCLGIQYLCGTCDQILLPVGMLMSEICGLVSVGLPLWRKDGSAICIVITQWFESRRTRSHTLRTLHAHPLYSAG